MPHRGRAQSESGFYHAVPKGLNDQILFESDGDRRFYISLLRRAQEETGAQIHAYCLMSNHVHLVLEATKDALGMFLKFVHERYGSYFANKTGRRGGIFYRPSWSEPIETDEHLLCAVRYVHANPTAAGICPPFDYEWSSAKDYLGRRGITRIELVLNMLGGVTGFLEFSRPEHGTALPFEGSALRGHLTDEEAAHIASDVLGQPADGLAAASPEHRRESLRLLRNRGLSVRQLARVCGLGKHSVQSALEGCLRVRKGVAPTYPPEPGVRKGVAPTYPLPAVPSENLSAIR